MIANAKKELLLNKKLRTISLNIENSPRLNPQDTFKTPKNKQDIILGYF